MYKEGSYYQLTIEDIPIKYEVINQQETTEQENYTDITGVTYKNTSAYVYTDREGKLRSFSDDIMKEIKHREDSIDTYKKWIYDKTNSLYGIDENSQKLINLYKKWIHEDEKRLAKLYKDLQKGI